MRIKSLSIGQLYALREILHTQNLTIAANRCASTQPGMSITLKKLRNVFNDDLLIQNGNKMSLTYRGHEIKKKLDHVFESIESLKYDESLFDYLDIARRFTLAVPSFLEKFFTEKFISINHDCNKNIAFDVVNFNYVPNAHKFCDECIDLMLCVVDNAKNLPRDIEYSEILSSEMMCCVSGKSAKKNIDLDNYFHSPHLALRGYDNSDQGYYENHLKSIGLKRNVIGTCMNCDSMFQLQHTFSDIGLIISFPEFVFNYFENIYDIHTQSLPFDPLQCKILIAWHKKNTLDPAVKWLIHKLSHELFSVKDQIAQVKHYAASA